MKLITIVLFYCIFFIIFIIEINPCTTAIISSRASADGRPLLLKHRDSNSFQNRLMFYNDGKFEYIGLVNSSDTDGKEVWAGYNETGFAIMNSASYNLRRGDTTSLRDLEGVIMKLALQNCRTVYDFEILLDTLPKPLGVEANFGVIDASGGAAYYECDNFSFTKYDVNDPVQAPNGYLIRTNFSFSGEEDKGYGYIRYETAVELFEQALNEKNLTPKFILTNVSRSLKHSLLETDLLKAVSQNESMQKFHHFEDYIPRYISTSSIVIQGVKDNEDPKLTTMWTILGFPLTSIAIPVWIAGGNKLPYLLTANSTGNAAVCKASLKLKDECFPVKKGSGYKYLNLYALLNKEETGILQKLKPIEEEIFSESDKRLAVWRKSAIEKNKILEFYNWLEEYVSRSFKETFGNEILD